MSYLPKLIAVAGIIAAPAIQAQNYNLSEYKASPGLTADDRAKDSHRHLGWREERGDPAASRVQNGTPIIQDVALRHKGGTWATLATNLDA